eukprot:g19524.t1
MHLTLRSSRFWCHADAYPALKIDWVSGLSPELKLYDSEDLLMAKIPLDKMKRAEIHDMMQNYGFAFAPAKDEDDSDLDDFADAAKSEL